jgi:hypothetical protein
MYIRIQYLQREELRKIKKIQKSRQLADLLFENRLEQKRNQLMVRKAKEEDVVKKRA